MKRLIPGIPIDATLTFGAVTASTAYEDYRHILMHEAQSATPDRPLSRQAKSIVDGQSKVNRCIASGYTPRQCCQALAWEASLQGDMNPNWDYLTNTHSLLSEQSAQVEDGTRAHSTVQSVGRACVAFLLMEASSVMHPQTWRLSRRNIREITNTVQTGSARCTPSVPQNKRDAEFIARSSTMVRG